MGIYRNHSLSATFVAAAVLTAPGAWANEPGWQEVTNDPEVVVEVDAANIRVRESKLTAWVRLTTPRDIDIEGTKVRSTISLTVFDCDAEKSGVTSTTAFAGPRGEGKIVHTEDGLPVPIASLGYERPGTPGYKVLKFVCERGERSAELVRDAQHAGAPANVTRPANPDDFYPPGSIRRREQGSPVVQVCVGPSGRLVREPVVTETSGFPELDGAAIKVAKATRYAAGTENGAPLPESCLKFKVKFAQKEL